MLSRPQSLCGLNPFVKTKPAGKLRVGNIGSRWGILPMAQESSPAKFSDVTQTKPNSWNLAVFYDKVKVDITSECKLYCNYSMTRSPNPRLDGKSAAIAAGASDIALAFTAANALETISAAYFEHAMPDNVSSAFGATKAVAGTHAMRAAASSSMKWFRISAQTFHGTAGRGLRRQRRAILAPEGTAWTYGLKTK